MTQAFAGGCPRLASGRGIGAVHRGLGRLCGAVLLAAGLASGVAAQQGARVVVVGNDYGGLIDRRVQEIQSIASRGDAVEIRGDVCFSTCTMYLGLAQVCVLPGTRFGFHGPTSYGRKLSDRDFEYWSRIIVAHYPESLRDWYMNDARERIWRPVVLEGSDLIRLGVKPCAREPGATWLGA